MYTLIEVSEREIGKPIFFKDESEAYKELCNIFLEASGMSREDFVDEHHVEPIDVASGVCSAVEVEDGYGLGKGYAWLNKNHGEGWDATVFEVEIPA